MSLHDPPLPSPSSLIHVSVSPHLHLSFPSSYLSPFFACSFLSCFAPQPSPLRSLPALHFPPTPISSPHPFVPRPSPSYYPPTFPSHPASVHSPIALPPFLLSLLLSTPSFSVYVSIDPVRSSLTWAFTVCLCVCSSSESLFLGPCLVPKIWGSSVFSICLLLLLRLRVDLNPLKTKFTRS